MSRGPRGSQLTIYYPISRYDEFPPSPVTYTTDKRVAPADILKSIWETYRTRLPPESVAAYLEVDEGTYDHLRTEPRPVLRDVLNELIFIEGLEPYQDGFILNLGS